MNVRFVNGESVIPFFSFLNKCYTLKIIFMNIGVVVCKIIGKFDRLSSLL